MAGADGQQLWALTRRAASLLRMARLVLTGATPAQLPAEGEVIDGCNLHYESVSTEDDGLESGGEKDEPEQLLLAGDEDDGSRTRAFSEDNSCRLVGGRGGGGHMSSKSQLRHRRPATTAGAAFHWENGAAPAEESVAPLMPRGGAKRANDVESTTVDHPFGCDRRGREASSLLLLSS